MAFFAGILPAQEYREVFDSLDMAQLKVLYNYTWKEDSTKLDWIQQEEVMLYIGNHISQFESYLMYQRHHIAYYKRKDGTYYTSWMNSEEEFRYRGKNQFCVYKNYPAGKMTFRNSVFMTGLFKYEEEMNAFDWEILDDTLTVGDYLCQKAVCQYGGRTWEAWFTDELPFEDGPYKFHGLPGLILKVADTRNHYRFDLVSVEVPPEGTEVEWYNSGSIIEMTTREEFLRIQEEARQNVMSHFDERTSPEAQKRACYAMKIRNNHIELK